MPVSGRRLTPGAHWPRPKHGLSSLSRTATRPGASAARQLGSPLRPHLQQKTLGCNHWNTAKRVESESVLIPTDDARSLTADCQFQKFVILRITVLGNDFSDVNQLCLSDQRSKELQSLGFSYILVKALAPEHLVEFVNRRYGKQYLSVLLRSVERLAWH